VSPLNALSGAFVPWFGFQLETGNSLIGARREVYDIERLTATKKALLWYEDAPKRLSPKSLWLAKKRDDSKFTMPIQNNINQSLSEKNIFEEKRILNNFKKLTGFELCKSSNIAIFGTAKAAQTVFNFVKIFNLNIVCFIDDFKEGLFQNSNIKIVSYDEFIEQYQDNTDLILQGNYQKGNIQNRDRLNTKVIELSKLITDSRNYESI